MTADIYFNPEGEAPGEKFAAILGRVNEVKGVWPRRGDVRLWLSAELAKPFVFGPIAGLSCWRDAVLAAREFAPRACGLTGPCEVFLEGDPSRTAVFVTAVETTVLRELLGTASALQVQIRAVVPIYALISSSPENRRLGAEMVCCVEEGVETVLIGKNGIPLHAGTYIRRVEAVAGSPTMRRLSASHDIAGTRMLIGKIQAQDPIGTPIITFGDPGGVWC